MKSFAVLTDVLLGSIRHTSGLCLILGVSPGLFLTFPIPGQTPTAQEDGPHFADVWFGGPLDSLYAAEYARLDSLCAPVDEACFVDGIDTTAVELGATWEGPETDRPSGHLVARLGARGRWPYASLLFRPVSGNDVVLQEDLGDWGYGNTISVSETAARRVRLVLPEVIDPVWIDRNGDPGMGVVEIFGLAGRLWRLGPVEGRRVGDDMDVELPPAVYFVTDVGGGVVHLRPEIPSDMPCEVDPEPDPETVPSYEVLLDDLTGADGLPVVEPAYPKGC